MADQLQQNFPNLSPQRD